MAGKTLHHFTESPGRRRGVTRTERLHARLAGDLSDLFKPDATPLVAIPPKRGEATMRCIKQQGGISRAYAF